MATLPLPSWPGVGGFTTINVPHDNATFTVNSSIHIDAPAQVVWSTIRNTTAFPEWNTFTPKADVTYQPLNATLPPLEQHFLNNGTKFTYTVVLNPQNKTDSQQSMELVSDVSTPEYPSTYVPDNILRNGSFYPDLSHVYRISWITDGPIVQKGLQTERFSEIIELEPGKGCEYRTWESQGGPLARQVKSLYGVLQARFGDWSTDLKNRSETLWKTQGYSTGEVSRGNVRPAAAGFTGP